MSNGERVKIVAVGAGVPDRRLPVAAVREAWGGRGGRGQVGVCAPDQDALTLAWDAATAALDAASVDADSLGGLWWGVTRPVFAEGPSHAYLASAVGLDRDAGGALIAGSPHAGVEALAAAWDAVAAGSVTTALVVVSDALLPGTGTGFETRAGAGAAALLLSSASGAATLANRTTRSQPAVDRYRGDREAWTREVYDPRLFREEVFVPTVLEVAEALAPDDDARWSLPDPDGRLGRLAAKRLGLDDDRVASAEVYGALGDTGAAAGLLGLLPALTEAGSAALVAFGGGRTSGVSVTVTEPVSGADRVSALLAGGVETSYAEALRSRGQLVPVGEGIEMGVPPGGAAFVRGNPEMLGLLGGQCADCDTISTPPSIHPHCINCGGPKLEPVALSRRGTVHTYVVNHTMPAPFEAPLGLAVLDLDDGARLMVQATTPEGLGIGADVELILRRYAVERGVPVYGFKARARTLRTDARRTS